MGGGWLYYVKTRGKRGWGSGTCMQASVKIVPISCLSVVLQFFFFFGWNSTDDPVASFSFFFLFFFSIIT